MAEPSRPSLDQGLIIIPGDLDGSRARSHGNRPSLYRTWSFGSSGEIRLVRHAGKPVWSPCFGLES